MVADVTEQLTLRHWRKSKFKFCLPSFGSLVQVKFEIYLWPVKKLQHVPFLIRNLAAGGWFRQPAADMHCPTIRQQQCSYTQPQSIHAKTQEGILRLDGSLAAGVAVAGGWKDFTRSVSRLLPGEADATNFTGKPRGAFRSGNHERIGSDWSAGRHDRRVWMCRSELRFVRALGTGNREGW